MMIHLRIQHVRRCWHPKIHSRFQFRMKGAVKKMARMSTYLTRLRSDSDVEIPTGSPPAPRPRPRKRGEKHTGRKTPCRLRRLSRIVSPTLRVDENSSEQMSGPAPCSSGEQSSCASTNQRKRRLSAIISQPLPNWEPPIIEVHTDDIRASSQQVLDETALARQRQRELWVRNPYSNPLGRGNLSTGPSEEAYAHFKLDSKVL
ncbi:hypothetical protein LWI29_025991 [Acer saccharum]|uniref:Uncharacterized protein n=1 Tax=Acer saccharum TaxID=4024 RepID=A0AA39SNI7_ACESA|nr:hypothetical protein LWI29_025991 [Acer saccharum]